MQTMSRTQTYLAAVVFYVDAHRPQHSLGVVSRQRFLRDSHFDGGGEAGEQDRALYLRARSAGVPVNAAQIHTVHGHWQPIPMLELELRAHVG